MKKFLLIYIIFFFSIINLYSQKNIIRGKVIDKTTGESLVGAVITIPGTTPVIATVTDYEGNYSFENIPKKLQELKCTFISYQDQIIKNININTNEVTILNISLLPITQGISDIIVSANAIKNSDNAIITMQKKATTLINGISAQSFSRTGDSDAASAVKRITGVSVEGGKYIFVRGLSDRYSKITLNGAEIPGLDPNKNTVQLDIFSTNIIENIIVQKTFSPNIVGSFSGGYVNISTKNFPNKFSLQVSSSVAYNPQANFNNKFLTYKGGTYDWLGIDDGTRAIPESALKNKVPFLYENNKLLDKISKDFNKIMTTKTKKSGVNHSHSISLGNQTKLFGKPLGYILDLSYSKKLKSYENGEFSRYNLVQNQNSNGIMNPLLLEKEKLSEQEIITSALAGLSYKFTPFNKIGLTMLYSGSGLTSSRYREGHKPEDDINMHEHTLGYLQRTFISTQLNGFHTFGKKHENKIIWISSLTKSILKEPDLRFFNFDSVSAENFQISYNAYPGPVRFYRNLDEINLDNKIHFSFALKKCKISFGTAYTMKNRNSESNKYDIFSQGLQFNGNIDNYLSDENIGQNATNSIYGIYYQNDPITDKYNSYKATELIFGTYIMTDFDLTKKISVQTGIRYELNYTSVNNFVEKHHSKYVEAQKLDSLDFLPALNINYKLTKKTNIRIAYAKTLARPSFREIAPYAYYDFKEGWRVVGNPELKRSNINNFDIRWEKFFEKAQLISASIFGKIFSNPIELIDDPRANNPELHYVNVNNSFLYGAEIEIRKNLDFINFENLLFGANFTFIKSRVKYVENYGGAAELPVNRPMYGQAPWILNAFVNYQNTKIGLNSNVNFNIDGAKLAVVTKGKTPDVYQQPTPMLNFNIAKNITKNLIIKLSISNILNSSYKKTYSINNKKYIFQSYKLNRTLSLSLKYIIE